MNRRETADAAPHPPIRSGLAEDTKPTCDNVDMSTIRVAGRTEGRSDPPVKPTSEVAHQPGQQPAALILQLAASVHRRKWSESDPRAFDVLHQVGMELIQLERRLRCGPGSAEECSAERSRAPETQPVAPARGSRLGNPCDEDGLTR